MKRILIAFSTFFLISSPSILFAATDSFKISLNSTSGKVGEYVGITVTAWDTEVPGPATVPYYGTVTLTASSAVGTYNPSVSGNFSFDSATYSWSGGIQLKAAGDISLTCTGAGGFTGNTQIALAALPATQLLIFVPGQTRTPGLAPGATPDVANVFDGVAYNVTVYAVDQYWNVDTTFAGNVDLGNTGGTITPSTAQTAVNGRVVYEVSFSTTGGITLSTNVPFACSEYVNVQSTSLAWCYLTVPSQITAGVPFSLTATVSTSDSNPDQVLPSNNDTFNIARYIGGTSTPAPGIWAPIENFTVTAGRFSRHDFTYTRTGDILLKANKTSGGSVAVAGVNTIPIQVLPNVPAGADISITPENLQAQHQAVLSVLARDAYGNATRSSLRNFSVVFEQVSGSGYLSVTQTVTNESGFASTIFTGGNTNEIAQIRVTIRDDFMATVYYQETVSVRVSVAKTEAGSIVNYPNPFNPAANQTTSINYYLQEDSDIEIRIYDPFGRVVLSKEYKKDATDAQAISATRLGGANWEWNGKNSEGKVVANGIYFLKIIAKTSSSTQEFKRRVGVLK